MHDVPVPLLLQQHYSKHDSEIPTLLQTVQVEDGNYDFEHIEKLGSSNHCESGIRWKEICERIKIDADLGERGKQ
jgi:hypothetical protein